MRSPQVCPSKTSHVETLPLLFALALTALVGASASVDAKTPPKAAVRTAAPTAGVTLKPMVAAANPLAVEPG